MQSSKLARCLRRNLCLPQWGKGDHEVVDEVYEEICDTQQLRDGGESCETWRGACGAICLYAVRLPLHLHTREAHFTAQAQPAFWKMAQKRGHFFVQFPPCETEGRGGIIKGINLLYCMLYCIVR